jgi:hypothetical protein
MNAIAKCPSCEAKLRVRIDGDAVFLLEVPFVVIEVGDLVRSKITNNVPMTVQGYDSTFVDCVWFEQIEPTRWVGPHRMRFDREVIERISSMKEKDSPAPTEI